MENQRNQKARKKITTGKTNIINFRTNFQVYKPQGKVFNDPSLCQPNMALSINDLLLNHTRGYELGVQENQGEYFDTEIPRFTDITEFQEWKNALKDDIRAEEARLKALALKNEETALNNSQNALQDALASNNKEKAPQDTSGAR